jgi:hypothetical protein
VAVTLSEAISLHLDLAAPRAESSGPSPAATAPDAKTKINRQHARRLAARKQIKSEAVAPPSIPEEPLNARTAEQSAEPTTTGRAVTVTKTELEQQRRALANVVSCMETADPDCKVLYSDNNSIMMHIPAASSATPPDRLDANDTETLPSSVQMTAQSTHIHPDDMHHIPVCDRTFIPYRVIDEESTSIDSTVEPPAKVLNLTPHEMTLTEATKPEAVQPGQPESVQLNMPQPEESPLEESPPEESPPEESHPEESQPEEGQPEESPPEESPPKESPPKERQPEESRLDESTEEPKSKPPSSHKAVVESIADGPAHVTTNGVHPAASPRPHKASARPPGVTPHTTRPSTQPRAAARIPACAAEDPSVIARFKAHVQAFQTAASYLHAASAAAGHAASPAHLTPPPPGLAPLAHQPHAPLDTALADGHVPCVICPFPLDGPLFRSFPTNVQPLNELRLRTDITNYIIYLEQSKQQLQAQLTYYQTIVANLQLSLNGLEPFRM